jgi:dTMP kinase
VLSNPGPGKFIVIEGLDGAGKTTQVQLLYQRLRDLRSMRVTREPTDGPVGLQIRMVLEHRVKMDAAALAALFAADRMDHLYHREGDGGIVAWLEQRMDVICDRYYLSSFAYQGMSLDWEWIWHMHAYSVRPDMIFFIDGPVETCLERIAASRSGRYDLFENRKALARARQSHLDAIARLCQFGDRIEVVDGTASPAEVHNVIWQVLGSVLPQSPSPGM